MALLPFNISRKKKIKVIIVGGGYAGLAALTNLLQFSPETDVTLIDPHEHHLKITHLHETFRYPLTDLLVPFADICKRFECRFIQANVNFDPGTLSSYQDKRQLIVNEETLDFDYLIIATGCNPIDTKNENAKETLINSAHEMKHEARGTQQPRHINMIGEEASTAQRSDSLVQSVNQSFPNEILSLSDFTQASGSDLLTQRLNINSSPECVISIVGGGATGIQFLFEIQQFINRIKRKAKLQLIHSGEHVLNQFPDGFGAYAESRMHELDIAFYPNTHYREQQSGKILLTGKETKNQYELPSDLTLLFLGKKRQNILTANAFGQITVDKMPLPNIFTAGDCSYYQSLGSNTVSAQSAVRKGKLVARNILRHAGFPGLLEPYLHQNLGYVVNLGASDAVGWLVAEGNLVTGIPALTIKEIVEVQYDLLLAGIDTYLV